MPHDLMSDILIIFGLSVGVLFLFAKIRVPALVGFIFTGMLAGPHGLGLIHQAENVEILAEVGIVALLFTIGLEFSFRHLVKIRRSVLFGGSLQVGLTTLAGAGIAALAGFPVGQSLFFGFLLSLSSTAIVLKALQDRAELDTPHGSAALGILIFQDLAIVPMILLVPLLAGMQRGAGPDLYMAVAKGTLAIAVIAAGAKWIVPFWLHAVARSRSRELFLLAVILICLSVAWLTNLAGLSLALGAFLAGLMISESPYSHEAVGHVLPFRDVFTSFFFVSVGMLLDMAFFLAQPFLILGLTIAVLLLKEVLAAGTVAIEGRPLRVAIMAGLALSQIGEFSFVLSKVGMNYGLMSPRMYQIFLAVSVFTMALTPFVIAGSPRLARLILSWPLPARFKKGGSLYHSPKETFLGDHLIIIGFGLNGRNIARAAGQTGIPYVILETNPDTVREERRAGLPIHYGDATHEAVLDSVGVRSARTLVVAINDPTATRRIVELARRLNGRLHIIVRTRYLGEMAALHELGADEVIPEEFETSIEIFARVLRKYLIPKPEIDRYVSEIRTGGYDMLRALAPEAGVCTDLRICLPDAEVATFRIEEESVAASRTIGDMALRKKHGVTILAIRRGDEMLYNPDPAMQLSTGDILVSFGAPEQTAAVAGLFAAGGLEPERDAGAKNS
ncbi:MAG: potassium transporter KefB [Syntrophaceae bacterium]|nr:potassium transporter KefB [Syntrophaceae bacterium]